MKRQADDQPSADTAAVIDELCELYKVAQRGTQDTIVAFRQFGKRLCDLKEELPHGSFLKCAKKATSLGTTQLNIYMTLHRSADEINFAREWNQQRAKPDKANTPEALCKLRAKWKNRDIAPAPSSTIEEREQNIASLLYNLWSHPNTQKGEVDNAEFKLHRFAARRRKSMQAYLKSLGFEVPEFRNFGSAE